MNPLEDMSQNVDFGPKKANLDQKGPKMGGTRFFPVLLQGYFINRPKMQFKYAKLRRSYDSFFEKLAKMSIFGLKRAFFGPKLAKNGPNGIFRAKSKNVTFVALGSPNLKISMNGF